MRDDITDILSLEVKKEMADRYFGFRKLIEEDIREYDDQVLTSVLRLEQQLGFGMVRLYILLKDENLIHEFFRTAGLQELLFYDTYLTESTSIRKKVFAGLRSRGLTRAGRFRNMVLDTYAQLADDIDSYRSTYMQLAADRENIAAEIRHFYSKHDLGTMMDFLRRLDGSGQYKAGTMEGGLNPLTGDALEQKMKVEPPPPIEQQLPAIPALAPLNTIRSALKKIAERAYRQQQEPDIRDIIRP